jgi:SAM-dependent methyltransferase
MDLSERRAGHDAPIARHPWEIERFRAYRAILAEHGALGARRVLDVGAGDGWFAERLLADLPDAEQIVCWDINYSGLELATDHPRLVRTTAAPSPGFDLIVMLDVLEHIAEPEQFIAGVLAPLTFTGTPVLVGVPAHQWLFGEHDRSLGHYRRYNPAQLRSEVSPWIEVIDHGSLFTSLVAPRLAVVAVERARRRVSGQGRPDRTDHGVGRWARGPLATRVVAGALAADSSAGRRLRRLGVRVPGLSTWVYGVTR